MAYNDKKELYGVEHKFERQTADTATATFDCKAGNSAEALEKFYAYIKKGAMFAHYGLPKIIAVKKI